MKKFDWHLLWLALGVITPTIASVYGCYSSLSDKIIGIEREVALLQKDMAIIKTVMIMNGHFPKELAIAAEEKI